MSPHLLGPHQASLQMVIDIMAKSSIERLPVLIHQLLAALQASRCSIYPCGVRQCKSDTAVTAPILSQYKTLLSSLLSGRKPEGRWVAAVLIKATLEIGNWEMLQSSTPWCRGLLEILTKPNLPETQSIAVITLSRLFELTRSYPTLVRELTTPHAPTFIHACIELISESSGNGKQRHIITDHPYLSTILEALCEILLNHPTLIRPHAMVLNQALLRIIVPTPSTDIAEDHHPTHGDNDMLPETLASAQKLWVLLPFAVPKERSEIAWTSNMDGLISNLHHTADLAFRAVHEDWQSSSGWQAQPTNLQQIARVVTGTGLQPIESLPRWIGVYAGVERIAGLLQLLRIMLKNPTPTIVDLHMGKTADVLTRVMSLTVPSAKENHLRLNPQIGKAEKDGLFLGLPRIHAASLAVMEATVDRLGPNAVSLGHRLLRQITWVFKAESWHPDIRMQTYLTLTGLLPLTGASLSKSAVDSMSVIIRACCDDILPSQSSSTETARPSLKIPLSSSHKARRPNASSSNADTFTASSQQHKASIDRPLITTASQLLPLLLTHLPSAYLSPALRARLERTSILTSHLDGMLAAVLNVPATTSAPTSTTKRAHYPSILPHLARAYPTDCAVEGLLHPRLPFIGSSADRERIQDLHRSHTPPPDGPMSLDVESSEDEVESSDRFISASHPLSHSADVTMHPETSIEAIANETKAFSLKASRQNDGGPPERKRSRSIEDENIIGTSLTATDNGANKRTRVGSEPSASETLQFATLNETVIETEPSVISHRPIVNTIPNGQETIPSPATKPESKALDPSTQRRRLRTEIANEDSDDDDDDDDVFEIPQIVMSSSDEEEGEEDEETVDGEERAGDSSR